MMKPSLISILTLAFGVSVAPAAEVWAPGVSRDGGWYDFHKTASNDGEMADTAMCWAASASNVIAWWQNHNANSVSPATPQDEAVFDTFKGVFTNGGGKSSYAYQWWITGDYNAPEGNGWAAIDKELPSEYVTLANGGFLSDVYDLNLSPITIATSSNNPYTYSEAVVEALDSGYALTLSVENQGIAHAYTLWGAEYEITKNGYELTAVWLTNSDDIYNAPEIFRKDVVCTYVAAKNSGSVAFDENMGATFTDVAGLRTSRLMIPEPTTATLSLLALAGLAARRRRK